LGRLEEGRLNVYGKFELPQYKGIGRKPLPKLIPFEDLKYIKGCKKVLNLDEETIKVLKLMGEKYEKYYV